MGMRRSKDRLGLSGVRLSKHPEGFSTEPDTVVEEKPPTLDDLLSQRGDDMTGYLPPLTDVRALYQQGIHR